LKGLEQGQNPNLGHLVGSTHHNMGMVHLCVGNFDEALQAFEKAVESRVSFFSQNHPLVAVRRLVSISSFPGEALIW
jgi:hypothetical protein